MKTLFRFSLIFFSVNLGLLCIGVFIKVNPFISSLEETGNVWLIIFGFVTDSFHIDWKSFINNIHVVTSLVVYDFEGSGEKLFQSAEKSVTFAHASCLLSQIIVILGFLEQYFQLVSENLIERYQKNKLHSLGMVRFGGNY